MLPPSALHFSSRAAAMGEPEALAVRATAHTRSRSAVEGGGGALVVGVGGGFVGADALVPGGGLALAEGCGWGVVGVCVAVGCDGGVTSGGSDDGVSGG